MTVEAEAYQDPEVIRHVLHHRNVAIVGLSSNRLRASHFVGFYLQRHGYNVIPVNPREEEVLGQRSYASLADVPGSIDVVDVFRAPEHAPQVAKDAVAVGAKTLWLQFDVISPEAAEIGAAAGLDVVMDRCMKIEHARYMGRMHWFGLNTNRIDSRRAG